MFYYVYTDHAQYTIKTYAKMALFPLLLTGPLSEVSKFYKGPDFTVNVQMTVWDR